VYPARHVQSVSELPPSARKVCAGQSRHVSIEVAAMELEKVSAPQSVQLPAPGVVL